MGRGKLPLKLIEKLRARRITCTKRKSGLLKKAYELSTLCDVPVCLVIHDSTSAVGPDIKTWPEDPDKVERILADYLTYKAKNPSSKKDLTTADFFNDRVKKLRLQNERLLKQDEDCDCRRIQQLSTEALLELLANLDAKIDGVKRLKADRAPRMIDQASSCSREHAMVVSDGDAFYGSRIANYPSYYTNLLEGGVGFPAEYWYGSELAVPGGDLIGDYGQYQNFAVTEEQVNFPAPMMNWGGGEGARKALYGGADSGFGKAEGCGHGRVWF